jgi:hypothetical protein
LSVVHSQIFREKVARSLRSQHVALGTGKSQQTRAFPKRSCIIHEQLRIFIGIDNYFWLKRRASGFELAAHTDVVPGTSGTSKA